MNLSKAIIREIDCVGCGKCLSACPVDAIIGAPKWMHTVLESDCIGCKLCVAPCPMDCIEMIEIPIVGSESELFAQKKALADRAKTRFQIKKNRIEKIKSLELLHLPTDLTSKLKIQNEIKASIKRVRDKVIN